MSSKKKIEMTSTGKPKWLDEWEAFTKYLKKNPEQRFWQALKNWDGAKAIWRQTEGEPTDITNEKLEDTYED